MTIDPGVCTCLCISGSSSHHLGDFKFLFPQYPYLSPNSPFHGYFLLSDLRWQCWILPDPCVPGNQQSFRNPPTFCGKWLNAKKHPSFYDLGKTHGCRLPCLPMIKARLVHLNSCSLFHKRLGPSSMGAKCMSIKLWLSFSPSPTLGSSHGVAL